ncbi:related to xylan 1,4-beta-xylosidase [Cephalotrichum gorgonifer]|uniref:xylan 1,4-beta-xylosidase n=1 Tax=Cephalotrichum gorgonifer TaxID=2041049 RepID=A0AAE8SVC1_9PEZI|nr:related to xylan 1,4-beta-xylosidase [Cephalotrichum gorgonifer]
MKYSALVSVLAAGSVVAQERPPRTTFPDCVDGSLASNAICDQSASPAARASALIGLMNTEEKLQNLVSKGKGAPRIGLPDYNWWSEALHGVAYAPGIRYADTAPFNSSTVFPMPVLMAAAFDDELLEEIATVIGIEARAWGNYGYAGIDYWTPNVNTFKDPRWGRGSETPGEDALRAQRYAASMVRGLEGDKPERRVIATCKHYAGNDFENWNGVTRHDFDAQISLQDLSEYYLAPFQQCTRDSKAGSIMCAYNAVNGVPSCANEYLIQTILRDHWNWTDSNNYITSDCEAVLDVSLNHHYAETNAEGTAVCFKAGMDLSCEYEGSSDIPGAWDQGLLPIETVDRALQRLYEGLVRAGYFDGSDSEYAALGWEDVNTPHAQELALQAAIEGIVMLKNDDTLPLELSEGSKIALIGFWADDASTLSGGYSGRAPFLRTPAYAARGLGLDVSVATGPVLQNNSASDNWTTNALEAAEKSDFILYFGGQDTSAAGETLDRYSLAWPEAQLTLLEKLSELGKPLVVVQMGDQLDDTPLLENDGINGILWASWPGQDGGTAVLDLITGAKSPSGRLPVTQYPVNYTDVIPITDMNLRPTDEYPGRTYRWYPTPILPFGFGLHYTTFDISFANDSSTSHSIQDLVSTCNNTYPDTCAFPSLKVEITNTGEKTSDYVALAFLSGEYGPEPYPIKTLASYGRHRDIAPGEVAEIPLTWTLGNVARVDEEGNRVLYPGEYTVQLDEPVLATFQFELTGDPEVLDAWPAAPE